MSSIQTHLFPALSDNYGVLIHDPDAGTCATIDCPDEDAVRGALAKAGWTLTHILITHHHWDHTQALKALKTDGVVVYGPKREAANIEGLDELVGEGDMFRFGNADVHVLETPGHTAGHIAYWIPSASLAFVGDTCFAMGCGRLFEGTAAEMWSSISKIAGLPDNTKLYCGHEYTVSNAEFAITVDPDNQALKDRMAEVKAMRERDEPTVPTTVGQEKATNPYMRADDPAIAATVGLSGKPAAEVFAEIRTRKDNF
jgi:hydroxyacylglutathione hydrolase